MVRLPPMVASLPKTMVEQSQTMARRLKVTVGKLLRSRAKMLLKKVAELLLRILMGTGQLKLPKSLTLVTKREPIMKLVPLVVKKRLQQLE
jgi:hypothetical protein